jgi:hypothetical protein
VADVWISIEQEMSFSTMSDKPDKIDQFAQIEADSKGVRKFLKCPHMRETLTDRDARFVNLMDTPESVITLVLCNHCVAVVGITLLDERLSAVLNEWANRTLPRNFFRKG